jgi:demethylmenaquinone methyltransferase / 2-methoxy-6-polyprenyl-1,4-benzoquinol methylase
MRSRSLSRLTVTEHRLDPVAEILSQERAHAQQLFAPLAPTYDRYARLLSLGQDPRWRSFLVSRVQAGPGDRVLDVATGTGAVALELARELRCEIVGVDQSAEMLAAGRERIARAGLSDRIELVQGHADQLPFEDESFDALTFTYLLRYVADPAATLSELARVVRRGGTVAALEFGVPPRPLWRGLWELYVRIGLPLAGRVISPGWRNVGTFLGSSISSFYRRYPIERQLALWRDAGLQDVRLRRLSLGGGIVTWARRA